QVVAHRAEIAAKLPVGVAPGQSDMRAPLTSGNPICDVAHNPPQPDSRIRAGATAWMADSFRNSSPSRASAATDTSSEASRIPLPSTRAAGGGLLGATITSSRSPTPSPRSFFSLLEPARADRPPQDTFFDALNARADWKP